MSNAGKWLIVAGACLILLGLIARTGALGWLGRLPGDIRIERPGFSFYLPVTTMILISVVGSVILYLVRRFL